MSETLANTKEAFSFSKTATQFATWLDRVAETSKNKNITLSKDGKPLEHQTVWFGLGIAAIAGIKMISNMETNGDINMTGLDAIGNWLHTHGYTGEFMHDPLSTYGEVESFNGSPLTSGNTRIESISDIAEAIAIDPNGIDLLIEQTARPEELRFQSLYELSQSNPKLWEDWFNLSQALYKEIMTLRGAKGYAGMAKLTVGLAAFGSIGLAMLKHKGSEPVKISAPIHTPFGEIPSAADTIQILCKKFIPQT